MSLKRIGELVHCLERRRGLVLSHQKEIINLLSRSMHKWRRGFQMIGKLTCQDWIAANMLLKRFTEKFISEFNWDPLRLRLLNCRVCHLFGWGTSSLFPFGLSSLFWLVILLDPIKIFFLGGAHCPCFLLDFHHHWAFCLDQVTNMLELIHTWVHCILVPFYSIGIGLILPLLQKC